MNRVRAKKSLGQHFLKNVSAVRKIVEALDPQSGEAIIEIGPGGGALTEPLLERCREINCRYIGIEKDKRLVNLLRSELVNGDDGEILGGDALVELPKLIRQLTNFLIHYVVVGNIPYYITGHLLRVIGELNPRPRRTVLMIQREVAERICGAPPSFALPRRGGPKMNLLAASVQIWAEPKILFTLSPRDFSPPPKVESAVIVLETHAKPLIPRAEEKNYYRFIHTAFKQPRKKLVNNLAELPERTKTSVLAKLPVHYHNLRAQDLSINELVELSRLFR